MPSNIPATTIRIEPEVKKEASAILDELGLSMSAAMNMFLRAVIREGGMPFEMKDMKRMKVTRCQFHELNFHPNG